MLIKIKSYLKGENDMTFEMKLHEAPFELIKNRIKTIELRLYDEKRQMISVGDFIVFTKIF